MGGPLWLIEFPFRARGRVAIIVLIRKGAGNLRLINLGEEIFKLLGTNGHPYERAQPESQAQRDVSKLSFGQHRFSNDPIHVRALRTNARTTSRGEISIKPSRDGHA